MKIEHSAKHGKIEIHHMHISMAILNTVSIGWYITGVFFFFLGDRNFTAGPSDPYEILSIDNGNYLTFDKNGIFMFEIIVVDHDYR